MHVPGQLSPNLGKNPLASFRPVSPLPNLADPAALPLLPPISRWTDAFVGLSTCGRYMTAHRVLGAVARALEDNPTGHTLSVELMTHPGYPSVPPAGGCGEGPDAFSCSWERLHELCVLTAPTLRARLAQDGVQLCALEDLESKRPEEGVS